MGAIDNPLVGTTLVSAVNVVATYIALQLMESTGRLSLILRSLGSMLTSTVVVTMTLLDYIPNIVAVSEVMSFIFFFEIGLGPIPWLVVDECSTPS